MKHLFIFALRVTLCLAVGLSPLYLNAQMEKYSIWVPPFSHDTSGIKFDQYMLDGRNAAVRVLLASGRFTVVEREATKELEAERKLQKSESFIDGKVVEQGKGVGAEFILSGKMNSKTGILALQFTNVADNSKVEGGDCNLKESVLVAPTGFNNAQVSKKVNTTLQEILARWLAKDRYIVVKELDGDEDSIDEVLIAVGSNRNIKKSNILEVFYTMLEKVEDMEIERDIVVAEIKVDVVENANFSVCKVKSGKKDIKTAMNEKKKLYCRLRTKS